MAVVSESARFAQQTVDHMPVVDVVAIHAGDARQAFHQFVGIPDFDAPFVGADPHAPALQAARHTITIAAHAQDAVIAHLDLFFAHQGPGFGVQGFHDRQFFCQFGRTPGVALVHDAVQKGFVDFQALKIPAAAQQEMLVDGGFQFTVGRFHVAVLVRAVDVRGASFQPVMRQQLQILFVVAALGEAFFTGFRTEVMGSCGAVVRLVIRWDVSQFYQRALQPQAD